MIINVIGGSGFIGSNLIKQLVIEHDVVNYDLRDSDIFPSITKTLDVRSTKELNEGLQKSDWVVLLAAEHRDDVDPISLYYDVNVQGTANVLTAMEKNNIKKIIFTSSVAVYGLNKINPDELHPVSPFNHYGKSKLQAEELLREWYNKSPDDRTLIIIRPTVVFGPGNKGNVHNLLKQITSGKFLKIGKGNNEKSMAYVENIAGFIKHCIDKNLQGNFLYNYADKPDLTTNQLLTITEKKLGKKLPPVKVPYAIGYFGGLCFDVLSKITGKKFSISSVRVKKFCSVTKFSSEKALATGYKPKFNIEEGLEMTIDSIVNEKKAT